MLVAVRRGGEKDEQEVRDDKIRSNDGVGRPFGTCEAEQTANQAPVPSLKPRPASSRWPAR